MPLIEPEKINRLVIAAAGSGKTSYLVSEALDNPNRRVLITTFTQANEAEIRKKIIEECKCIPSHITVQTWFSFLLQHGVRPFQGALLDRRIRGLILVSGQSAVKYYSKIGPVLYKEATELEYHYFSPDLQIYSDKLAKFVFRCNEKSDGRVIKRLEKLFSHILVDEVQDLAGYDLELIRLFLGSACSVELVGDPRQVTYTTHWEHRFKQYSNGRIKEFIEKECTGLDCLIEERFLNRTHRNNEPICGFANALYPQFEPCEPSDEAKRRIDPAGHTGVFLISYEDAEQYLETFRPMQLRWSKTTPVNSSYPVMNYGDAKGLTFPRVLIYPTGPVRDYLECGKSLYKLPKKGGVPYSATVAKLYVAVTRAIHSVAFVCDTDHPIGIDGIERFSFT